MVLASSEDALEMRQLTVDHCQAVRELLLRRYTSVVCDTGNNEAAATFLAAVDNADVLVVPTAPRDDHLYAAGQMLEFLAHREQTRHLLTSVVFVITSDTGD